MTREFRLVRAKKCPTSSMGVVLSLYCSSPGAQSSEGSLQAFKQCVQSLKVEHSPTWGASPFILQGGAPCLHISIEVSWFRPGVLYLRQSAGPARLVGSAEACVRMVFLGDGLSSYCPVSSQSEWLCHSVGRSSVTSFPVRPYGLFCPYHRCTSFPAWLLTEGLHAH